ncbi:MAG: DEAD/DEAH box helicase, partial [Candidatus Omnitrophica bacterium]|nr:DEAD/DEAH box helicase [Candidatus Omnitrophota bacterium]
LDPVIRAVQMPRVNLLLADDVGLGKTIEAGLVLQELILRHRTRKILIICPASLQIQWRDQMRDKFGLEFRIVDTEMMRDLRRSRGIHANPWSSFPRLITSIDFIKREKPLRLFRELLPSQTESMYPRRFDMLVVDEAHNVAPSGRGHYAIDSQRTSAIRELSPHFEHRLFLTATPHNGYSESFTAFLELLDSQRFARGIEPDHKQIHAIMVRRMKSEFKDWAGERKFPKRVLEPIEVGYTDEEREIHKTLQEYTRLRCRDVSDNTEKTAVEFVLKLLKKRLFSSPEAFALTLAKHEEALAHAKRRDRRAGAKPTVGILRQRIEGAEEDLPDDEERESSSGEVIGLATTLFRSSTPEEEGLLSKMRSWGERASARADSKTEELIRWLKQTLKPGGKWSDERVIIFTEYRATQKWLHGILAAEKLAEAGRLETLYGGMRDEDREKIKAAFQHDPKESPVRILLATDAASEGIDLQNHCHRLIHFEIPWNPNRLEQRNGRVDRHGQKAPEVRIYHFVGKGYEERVRAFDQGHIEKIRPGDFQGDIEFLMIAARKVENIRADLGKVGPVIAEQVEDAMLGRRRNLDTRDAEEQAKPISRILRFERDVRREIERFSEQLDETRRELRFTPENIKSIVDVALELAKQPALVNAALDGVWPDHSGRFKACPVFKLPPLRGSWAKCAEGLEHPHTRALRPITFDHQVAAEVGDKVVLCHLNHRLVQMALHLLRAEVWAPEGRKGLHRVTARTVPNHILDTPVVIAHARLVVIGGDHQRLHEEIITAGGEIKEGRLSRTTQVKIEESLASATTDQPVEKVKQRFQGIWSEVESGLVQMLETRVKERTRNLEDKMLERAEKEADDLKSVLIELQRNIQNELDKAAPRIQQAKFTFAEEELSQLERNMDALKARLARIPSEIEKETELIL